MQKPRKVHMYAEAHVKSLVSFGYHFTTSLFYSEEAV